VSPAAFFAGAQTETSAFVSTTTVVEPVTEATRSTISGSPAANAAVRPNASLPVLLGSIWMAGAGISLAIVLVGLSRLAWLASRARRVDTGRWAELAGEMCRALGMRRPIVLLQSEHPMLLMTWGLARPKILLPATACDWPDERARIVLLHELAHVRRGDWAAQIAAEVLRCLNWFNPLVWIACKRLRQESEQACDDAVLSGGVDGSDYATHLLDLARTLNGERGPWLPAPAMARPSSLEGRISAMLNASINRSPLTRSARIATLIAALLVVVPIAGAQSSFFTFSGSIVDATNRVLPGTTLLLTNTGSQAKYEIRSDSTGHFEFVGLPPGAYALEVKEAGFTTLKDTVTIAGRNVTRTLELQVGSLEETITISEDAGDRPVAISAEKLEEERQRTEQRAQRNAESRQRAHEKVRLALERCSATGGGPIGGNILAPMKLVDVKPKYPDTLKSSKIAGVVTMEALIGTEGTVRDVRVLTSPHPDLASSAVEAVRGWEYSPTLLNCTPIEVRMKVTTNFTVQP
jgi:TonB family protein